ncbi:hypothetical protein [Micavibrio aeruginosavorus]|uniref:Uncharacterized protein n=1 Tax=Micavibrio aeruginosavorus EPB TaxID=349215 RepID=M4VIQ9_9BACT|nr:hypothetical protein [Micavibrio aeruginosavorus]AGH98375.1 hypothetical protein A11S_1571 [Micavibrio aeruginosavorus EPB]
MFGKVFSINQKTVMDAIMFFVVQTVILVGISTTLVHVLGMMGVIDGAAGSFFEGGSVYTMIGSAFVLLLASGIVMSKGLSSDVFSIILAVAGIYLAWTTGVLLGLIPVALLSTFDARK